MALNREKLSEIVIIENAKKVQPPQCPIKNEDQDNKKMSYDQQGQRFSDKEYLTGDQQVHSANETKEIGSVKAAAAVNTSNISQQLLTGSNNDQGTYKSNYCVVPDANNATLFHIRLLSSDQNMTRLRYQSSIFYYGPELKPCYISLHDLTQGQAAYTETEAKQNSVPVTLAIDTLNNWQHLFPLWSDYDQSSYEPPYEVVQDANDPLVFHVRPKTTDSLTVADQNAIKHRHQSPILYYGPEHKSCSILLEDFRIRPRKNPLKKMEFFAKRPSKRPKRRSRKPKSNRL